MMAIRVMRANRQSTVKFDRNLVRLQTDALDMAYFLVPWDSEIFEFQVAQISAIRVIETTKARLDLLGFVEWLAREGVYLASCRVPHDRLKETMLLEEVGFRFVEMVMHPQIADLQSFECSSQGLTIETAEQVDLPAIENIAAHAFGFERFHVDPRLQRRLADHRYVVWVRNSLAHPAQCLYKISDGGNLVAFFVTESKPDGLCYWHLTAVAPAFQGMGYGKRVWRQMLHFHKQEGATRIGTTIAGGNTPVLNLYVRLGFRFQPPEVTLHWVRDA